MLYRFLPPLALACLAAYAACGSRSLAPVPVAPESSPVWYAAEIGFLT